ncbi:TolB protein precursor, periplasmic protein [Dissulfuribacter thermophilus]|uniref:TolB protein, periplasmic protein n=1 Tax=Dissulfuribacter thermophilus TaxID=1156395 RepID=A0A1B9F390_9BACT|nr:Tol-Pal system beta propeller repeat protein TolB [Dissulfuribacter thermophilus]OCC14409.1 TolB protein precursor, periplasmic protein [Dissulfuribacter thermophilus]
MFRSKNLLVFLFLLFTLLEAKAGQARLYIDITAPILRSIPIEIKAFETSPSTFENRELSKKIQKILKNDLDFHGFFKIIDQPPNEDYETVIEYIITGKLVRMNDKINVELRLFDAREKRMITGRRYRGSKDAYTIRKIAHRFTDLVVREITGEGGVSLSKITFVGSDKKNKSIFIADFDGFNLERLINGPAIKISPRISPDGKWIVYTSYGSGKPHLYLQDLKNRSIRKLATYAGINISPSWHPSGDKLAVTLSKDGNPDLYIIDLNGRVIERLTRGPGINCSPSWSPDGKKLVFVSDRYGTPQLFIMDVETKKVRRLTYEGKYNTDPQWSPRGTRIVYVGRSNGMFQIFTISPQGGDPVQLTYSGNNENPSWSPDGRQILFSSDRLGKKSIYVMDANGRRQRRLITLKKQEALTPFWGPNTFK